MIEAARPMVESYEALDVPDHTDLFKCSRCGNGLARAVLTPGSYLQVRCHHSIKGPDGKWKTCGMMNRIWPTR